MLSIDIVVGTNDGGSFDLSQVNHVLTKLYAISYFGTILDAQDIKFSIHSKGTYTRTNYSHPESVWASILIFCSKTLLLLGGAPISITVLPT